MSIITVSQLNRYLASKVSGDTHLKNFMIRGEISNFTAAASGHCYFSLKDEGSVIRAVMFKRMASSLVFQPENGMRVIATAGLNIYEAGGIYQLNVTDMQPDGVGAHALALQQRKKKLEAAGLFKKRDKRPIPALPKTVGVITSGTGAAVKDIVNNLQRRCPIVHIKLFPVLVQGADAPEAIERAVRFAGTQGCDVLIIGRGGGASEDLDAFNAENVAYAIYDCPVPVIAAVGHEKDFTIADAVADLRVSTPTGAAEAAVPELSDLHEQVDIAQRSLKAAFDARLREEWQRLRGLRGKLMQQRPEYRIRVQREQLARMTERLSHAMRSGLAAKAGALHAVQEKLTALDPLLILQRGYAAVYHENGEVLPSVKQVRAGEHIRVQLRDGSLLARVEETHEL